MRKFIQILIAGFLIVQPLTAQGQGLVTPGSTRYQLRPGDVLQINVWGQESFSGKFQIDETGRFEYPMLGAIDTKDLSLAQLRDSIRTGLDVLFKNPFVTITPLFRIAVLGQVRDPGLLTVDPTLTVIDVVALAGGPTGSGNMKKIKLLRTGGESLVNFEDQTLRGRTLQEVGIRSGDQVVVPRKSFTRDDLFLLLTLVQVALSVVIVVNTTGN
ncbi:MAG: polysaccharide biosynthesis/export family protein [Gemmatimonadales bacterium]